ncbi:hypothetical protein J2Y55_004565 [Bosea sp. BE125]|uniref:hypothetical protein n=1 Tax=Bosea sp. BE125 TaxID=2817909 RepID=UPI002859CF85|nr:hypothetical protein [Bosea sp. BE125]MDR6873538.1 hypothetical protein [Bosea sp. BE125]
MIDLKANLHSLMEQAIDAQPLEYRVAQFSELDGFQPRLGECHQNAARWVAQNEGFEVVRGWLRHTDWQFLRHSMVRRPWGEPMCVTLGLSTVYGLSFVEHKPEWGDYDAMGHEVLKRMPLTFDPAASYNLDRE